MKRLWINRKILLQKTTKIICSLYALLGFIGLFVSFQELLPKNMDFKVKIQISIFVLIISWIIVFVIICICCLCRSRCVIFEGNNGHKLYVQYGDMFNEKEVINHKSRRNIVIPVNRCFDTIVDNKLISENTLHGIAFKKLYDEQIYTKETLNKAIQDKLTAVSYEDLNCKQKPQGNTKRYPVGTVVDLKVNKNTHYILWALSTFDENLKAHTTMEDYVLAVQRLIKACHLGSGSPILLPLVGTGLSRTNRNQVDTLEYLIKSFEINREKLNCDIHIIVREDLKNQIPIIYIK